MDDRHTHTETDVSEKEMKICFLSSLPELKQERRTERMSFPRMDLI